MARSSRGDDQVLDGLGVARIQNARVNGDRPQLARTGHDRRNQAAAGGSGDLGCGQLLLGGDQLLLHLLRLLHQLRHVRAARLHAARVVDGGARGRASAPLVGKRSHAA
jgi:hypothetical protein